MPDDRTIPCTRWRRRKEARPGEILEAALACFAERGFAATRLDDVARRAGVTKGTLYLYFPNKEELFKAVVRQTIVSSIARAEAIVDDSAEPAPVLLERLIMHWAERIPTTAGAIPKLIITEAGNFPDLARFYLDEVAHRGMGVIRRVLRAGIERGEFRPVDVESTVRCIIAPILMAMLWRHSLERHETQAPDAGALCRAHRELLLRGLMPLEQRMAAAVGDRPARQHREAR